MKAKEMEKEEIFAEKKEANARSMRRSFTRN